MPKSLIRNLLLRLAASIDSARRIALLEQIGKRGSNTALRPNVTITHPERLVLGENVMINHGSMIFASGGVEVGDGVVMGPGTMILTGNHAGMKFYGSTQTQPVKIGSNVWLGAGVVVTPGSVIGDNVIVAAGSVVSGRVASDTIVGGAPARKIRDLTLPFEPRQHDTISE